MPEHNQLTLSIIKLPMVMNSCQPEYPLILERFSCILSVRSKYQHIRTARRHPTILITLRFSPAAHFVTEGRG